jgi:hypothetical protein
MLGFGLNRSKQQSTSTFSKNLNPEQQNALSGLSGFGQQLLTNPGENLKPLRTSAMQGVNDLFDRAPDQIEERLRSKGVASRGKLQRRLTELDMMRYGKLAGVENEFARLGVQQQMQGADILGQLLQQTFGYTQNNKGSQSGMNFNVSAGG